VCFEAELVIKQTVIKTANVDARAFVSAKTESTDGCVDPTF
jgi:hypothetical protein